MLTGTWTGDEILFRQCSQCYDTPLLHRCNNVIVATVVADSKNMYYHIICYYTNCRVVV